MREEDRMASSSREWEEIVCPICMEHPHNGVLLICSSHEKGCRPFICDTSPLLSNCLDRLLSAANMDDMDMMMIIGEVPCPFCRGKILGFDRGHPAREFMNSLSRSCGVETCSFRGNCADLQRHAGLEHPIQKWREREREEAYVPSLPGRYPYPRLRAMSAFRPRLSFPGVDVIRLNQPD